MSTPAPIGRARVAAVMFSLVLTVGTVGYLILGLSLLEAVYQTGITVTTVGFSEIGVDEDPSAAYRIFTLGLVLAGAGSVLFAAGVMVETMVESRLGVLQERRMQREIDRTSDHVIVCGFGRVGRAVVRRAASLGGHVVVIDSDDDALRGCVQPHIIGDATNDDVLVQAGVERAHSLVAALASDADNLFLAVSARRLNPHLRIVSRANAADSAQKLRTIDLDTVVEPYEMAGNRLATAALRPHTSDYLDQVFSTESDKVELTEVEVHEGGELVGLTTSEVELQCAVVLVAVRGLGEHDFVGASAHARPLVPGDIVIALGDRAGIRDLARKALASA
jgi:voltage-gated potassium channel